MVHYFYHFYNKCLAEIILKWRKLSFVLFLTHGFRDFSPWQMDSVDWVCGGKTTAQEGVMKFSPYLLNPTQ